MRPVSRSLSRRETGWIKPWRTIGAITTMEGGCTPEDHGHWESLTNRLWSYPYELVLHYSVTACVGMLNIVVCRLCDRELLIGMVPWRCWKRLFWSSVAVSRYILFKKKKKNLWHLQDVTVYIINNSLLPQDSGNTRLFKVYLYQTSFIHSAKAVHGIPNLPRSKTSLSSFSE